MSPEYPPGTEQNSSHLPVHEGFFGFILEGRKALFLILAALFIFVIAPHDVMARQKEIYEPTVKIKPPTPPASLLNIAATLRAMGRDDVATQLINDFRNERVTIANMPDNATTAPLLIIPHVTNRAANVMTLNQNNLAVQADMSARMLAHSGGSPVNRATLGLALTVIHEYVHMNQDNPTRDPRFENDAWRTTVAENQSWMRRVMSQITEAELHMPNGADKIARLRQLTGTLNDLQQIHNVTVNDLQLEINAGHVSPGLSWSTIDMGSTTNLNQVVTGVNTLLDTFNRNTRDSIARFERELRNAKSPKDIQKQPPIAAVAVTQQTKPPVTKQGTPAGGTYPDTPYQESQITYNVSGATIAKTLDTPMNDNNFTRTRHFTGSLGTGQLSVSWTAKTRKPYCKTEYGNFYTKVHVAVWVGGVKKEFSAPLPDTCENASTSYSGALSVPIPAGAKSGGFSIEATILNPRFGSRGVVVSGEFGDTVTTGKK